MSLGEGLAVVRRDAAVHDDVVDAHRIPMRIVVRRGVDDPLRIEDDEIGPCPVADDATVAQLEP